MEVIATEEMWWDDERPDGEHLEPDQDDRPRWSGRREEPQSQLGRRWGKPKVRLESQRDRRDANNQGDRDGAIVTPSPLEVKVVIWRSKVELGWPRAEVKPAGGESYPKPNGWRARAKAWWCLTQVEPMVRGILAKPNGWWSLTETRMKRASV